MFRVIPGLLALLLLIACTAEHKRADPADVARARYVDPNPPSITLLTSINTRTNTGAHSGLLINASQRVLFDPAGSWDQPGAPETEDVRVGMTPPMLANYVDFQGTAPFQLVQQTVYVSPQIAEQVMQAAMAHGAVNKAACTNAISGLLDDVPGFEGLPHTLFPKVYMKAFATLPGVQTQTLTSLDGDRRRTLPGMSLATQ